MSDFYDGFFNEVFDSKNNDKVNFTLPQLTSLHIKRMLLRTQEMFEWKNLPKTIPQRTIEMNLQYRGYVGFKKINGEYYASFGGIGAGLNFNYLPKKFILTNPYIDNGISEEYDIYYGYEEVESNKLDNYCVVIPNDCYYMGLIPICKYFAKFDAINDISLKMVLINSRSQNIMVAPDSNTANSVKEFLDSLEKGELSQITSKSLFKQLESIPYSSTTSSSALIRELIEHKQYNRALWYNEMGLQSNYNMKRESLNSNENQLNEDVLIPFPDLMLKYRKDSCKLINELYGLDIDVDFSSVWKDKRIDNKYVLDRMKAEINNLKSNKLDNEEKEDDK